MNLSTFAGYLSEFLGVIAVIIILDRTGKLTRRPVIFQYPQREKWAVLVISLLVFLVAFLIYRIPSSSDLIPAIHLDQSIERELLLAVICLLPATLALLYRKQPLLSTGWGHKPALKLALRVGLTLVFLSVFLRGKIYNLIDGVNASEGLTLLALAITCAAEETLFRGYLQLRLNSLLGERYGWLSTSLLFLLWQIPRLLFNPVDFWFQLGLRAIQSLLLGWIMWKCNHVLATTLYRTVSEWLSLI
jgi:membrane protease YdiL (CAAX protease family)